MTAVSQNLSGAGVDHFLLSQILIAFAICCDLLSFQFKDRQKILSILLISVILIGIHFALLEQWTAAGLAVVSSLRFIISIKTTSQKTMWFFVSLAVMIAIVTFSGPLSILTCLGSIFGTVGSFCKEDKRLRQFMLLGTALWLINNVLIGSPMAVVMEILFIGSNLIGYYRFYIKPRLQQLA